MDNQVRIVSSAFALCGFAVAMVSGIGAGASPLRVIAQSVVALFACQLIGMGAGAVAARVLADQELRYREKHPVPEVPAPPSRRDGVVLVDEVVEESERAAA